VPDRVLATQRAARGQGVGGGCADAGDVWATRAIAMSRWLGSAVGEPTPSLSTIESEGSGRGGRVRGGSVRRTGSSSSVAAPAPTTTAIPIPVGSKASPSLPSPVVWPALSSLSPALVDGDASACCAHRTVEARTDVASRDTAASSRLRMQRVGRSACAARRTRRTACVIPLDATMDVDAPRMRGPHAQHFD
jgi:hypothetical protein